MIPALRPLTLPLIATLGCVPGQTRTTGAGGGLQSSRLETGGGGSPTSEAGTSAAEGPEVLEISGDAVVEAGSTARFAWRVRDAAGLADDGVGRPATWARIGGPSGWVSWCDFPVMGTLVAGDRFDGRYEASCPVPAAAVNGSYGVWFGASSSSGSSAGPEAVLDFDIVGGSADTDVPVVSEFEAVPSTVNPGGSVTLRWRATDASGVATVVPWAMGPNGRFVDDAGTPWLSWGSATLVSGDGFDGRYEVTLETSPAAVGGRYDLWLSRADGVGNKSMDTPGAEAGVTSFDVVAP
jgi:hypothetical protein